MEDLVPKILAFHLSVAAACRRGGDSKNRNSDHAYRKDDLVPESELTEPKNQVSGIKNIHNNNNGSPTKQESNP
jgi:hypothetical protein